MSPIHRLLLCLCLVWLASCTSNRPEPQWRAGEIGVASESVLWEVTVLAMEKEGFPVGAGLDPADGVAISGWKSSLAPFKGKGWRARAHVQYERLAPGRYRVEVRVEKEVNEDLARPLDPSYAQWEPAADDLERADVLLQRIRSYLGGEIEVSAPQKSRGGR